MSASPIMAYNRKRSRCAMENETFNETEDMLLRLRERFEDVFQSKELWLRKQIEQGFDLDESTTSSSSSDDSNTSPDSTLSEHFTEARDERQVHQVNKRPRRDNDPILFECVRLQCEPMELPKYQTLASENDAATKSSRSNDKNLPEHVRRILAGKLGIDCDVTEELQPWLPAVEKNYRIYQLLGKGSFGTVYAGVRKLDEKPVAIKKLEKSLIHNWGKIDEMTVPLEFQLHIMSSGHPGIVTMFDWLETKEHYVLIMQRPDGPVTDLHEYCVKSGPLSEWVARRIYSQIAKAISHCHDNGVIHRDIKPRNILVNHETLETQLIDFGCGAVLKETPYTMRSGTLLYYPPEWFNTHHYFGRSLDVWALGVVLYMMIENCRPFVTKEDIIYGQVSFKRREQISRSCRNIIRWILTKDPEDRPTMTEILRHPWFYKLL